jgi:hypothetical protein
MDLVGPYYIILFLIIIAVLYVDHIPNNILRFIDSIWGKLLFIVLLLGLIKKDHSVIAILLVIFYFRVLLEANKQHNTFGSKLDEGFTPGAITNHHIVEKDHRWLVEKMLNERPYLIEDSVVTTEPIQ